MKKYILAVVIALITQSVFATNINSSKTTLVVDSVPRLGSDLAYNLTYNSLIYWHLMALTTDSLLVQERAKIALYERITGYQGNSVEDLERVYQMNNVLREEDKLALESCQKDLKKVNRARKLWKLGMFVVPPAMLVGGVILGTKIVR